MTPAEFREAFGQDPTHDELDRLHCDKAGEIGHAMCGLCPEHSKPRFICGCLVLPQYPHGKLNHEDEGETSLALSVQGNAVVIAFPKPMTWIGLDKASANALAQAILARAKGLP